MDSMVKESPPKLDYPRVLGRYVGTAPGPKIVAVAGMHGNEPAGIIASRRMLEWLEDTRPEFRGEIVVLTGNRQALARGVRFIEKDFNRQWTPEIVERVENHGAGSCAEHAELLELLSALRTEAASATGQVYFVDMHTSSAEGVPFITIGDTLPNRKFALNFPLPVILGLEEQIDGALLEFMNNLGYITLGLEGGQHLSERSVEFIEASLRLALVFSGQIDKSANPEHEQQLTLLRTSRDSVPKILEVRYRQRIRPDDEFKMLPGFTNFQPVRKGMHLADDGNGAILAPMSGRLLLPLYQGQGNDGFFIGRKVAYFWLRVSELLRRLHLGDIVHWLPGIKRHPKRDEVLVVNTRIAALFPLQIFHLLGFRKVRWTDRLLLVSRRRFDHLHSAH